MTRKRRKEAFTKRLFRDPSGQEHLFEKSLEEELEAKANASVECLGMTFENDDARREYFLEKLREKLRDPEFRKTEGFPVGSDEDILALSNPPYYTACPNPFIEDFIKDHGKAYDPGVPYSKEPFAGELAESRNNPFVNAHSYANKTPYHAIMRLLLYFTEPGDLVLDAYAGTGMSAIAAQICRDRKAVESLGYKVSNDGMVFDQNGEYFSRLGARHSIVGDLCPAATFISSNFNLPYDISAFEQEVGELYEEVERECGWMYQTIHKKETYGRIICTIWSDVFVCPDCSSEFSFWEGAVNIRLGKIENLVRCPHCGSKTKKGQLDRAWSSEFDDTLNEPVRRFKQIPVLILYEGEGKRFEKVPDEEDLNRLGKIEKSKIPHWFPIDRMPPGEESRRNDSLGITHVHHFFTRRNLWALATSWKYAQSLRAKFMLTSLMFKSSILCGPLMSNYFAAKKGHPRGGWVGKERSGTLYCPSIHSEVSILSQIKTRSRAVKISAADGDLPFITTSSATKIDIPDSCIDYIFTDPPFGANRMYSELNLIWESWLRVFTNNEKEAIQNKIQKKGLAEYEALMRAGFEEYYRVLKPGRWITVEFSNTKAAVWNALQTALGSAGFVIADVRDLDKKQGSILGYTTSTAVRQDLAISAYKPNEGLENRFRLEAGIEEGVWDFVRTHLKQLPIFDFRNGQAEVIAERQNYLLFDRMVAFHVQRGVTVPLSASEFYAGLAQRFPERDGMYFLPEQAAEYDKKRMTVKEVLQLELFVKDESSAIQWLKQQLTKKPHTFQEIHPQFLKKIGGWQKHEKALELSELLEENFLRYDGKGNVPSQIYNYISSNFKQLRNLDNDDPALLAKAKDRWYVPDPNKAGDLERLRERALLREFEEYRESKQKRLKVFRLEAVRAGFKKAWQDRNYQLIIDVACKIPENVLQEDPKLLMWYDQALTRRGT